MKKVLLIGAVCVLFLQTACFNGGSKVKLMPVMSNGQWGYIDKKGAYVINPQFESVTPFFEGLAKVTSEGKVGYISADGKYVVAPQYNQGTIFQDGLAFVVSDNSYPICINKKGDAVFTLNNAKSVSPFSEGLAAYCSADGKWGYVNTKGEIVINAQFDRASRFSEGLASVLSNDKWGFIDKKGNIVINYQFSNGTKFVDGLAPVSNGQKIGYIDKTGKYIINPQFNYGSCFHEGLAAVENGSKWGFVDKKGKYVINPQFDYAYDFTEGLAACETGGKYGYVDKKGKLVINPQFDLALPFHGGLAIIKSNEKGGYIDKKGSYVINPQFDLALPTYDEQPYRDDVKSTYYDASGAINKIFGQEVSRLMNFRDGATLQTVLNEDIFSGAQVEESDLSRKNLVYNFATPEDSFGDVSLNQIGFHFDSPVYEWDYGSYFDMSRIYNWSAKLESIIFDISSYGEAREHLDALVAALSDAFKAKAGINEMKTFDNNGNKMLYGYSAQKNMSIAILHSTNDSDILVLIILGGLDPVEYIKNL